MGSASLAAAFCSSVSAASSDPTMSILGAMSSVSMWSSSVAMFGTEWPCSSAPNSRHRPRLPGDAGREPRHGADHQSFQLTAFDGWPPEGVRQTPPTIFQWTGYSTRGIRCDRLAARVRPAARLDAERRSSSRAIGDDHDVSNLDRRSDVDQSVTMFARRDKGRRPSSRRAPPPWLRRFAQSSSASANATARKAACIPWSQAGLKPTAFCTRSRACTVGIATPALSPRPPCMSRQHRMPPQRGSSIPFRDHGCRTSIGFVPGRLPSVGRQWYDRAHVEELATMPLRRNTRQKTTHPGSASLKSCATIELCRDAHRVHRVLRLCRQLCLRPRAQEGTLARMARRPAA